MSGPARAPSPWTRGSMTSSNRRRGRAKRTSPVPTTYKWGDQGFYVFGEVIDATPRLE